VTLPASGNPRYEFGDEPILLDYEIGQTQVRPGDVLNVELYWQPESAVDSDYHVFVHLSNDADQILVQTDGPPRGGDYPTALWQSGEVVRDEYQLYVPPSTPEGIYHLWAGMYDVADGIRLVIRSDTGEEQPDNRAHLGTVRIGD
jgi:hypothetical protein